jgi:hypothetical protein
LLTPQNGAEMRRRLGAQAQRVRDSVAPPAAVGPDARS